MFNYRQNNLKVTRGKFDRKRFTELSKVKENCIFNIYTKDVQEKCCNTTRDLVIPYHQYWI